MAPVPQHTTSRRGTCLLVTLAIALAATPGLATGAADPRDPIVHHVVTFDRSTTSPAGVADAVDRAGGEVVDMLDPLGVALVRTREDHFLREAIQQDGPLRGGARNHRIGQSPTTVRRSPRPVPVPSRAWHTAQSRTRDEASGRIADLQWGNRMIGATAGGAHRTATGEGVTVAIIDTGVDARHPDLAPNVDAARSVDLVQRTHPDVPVDPGGHGTHIAGIVGAARDGTGITGVAPDATLISLRAGDDAGYFFVYEVAAALVAAADQGADVAVMSFFTDPWLYNCASVADYISGDVTAEQIVEQATIRETVLDALAYADAQGVTVVAAAGNQHVDLSAPERVDTRSPTDRSGEAVRRTVTRNCLDLPSEGPKVISVSAVGPSGRKAPYSSYGLGTIDLAAPGGWFGDDQGAARSAHPGNLVLSTYPESAGQRRGFADATGRPADQFSRRDCGDGGCGFYTYLQGTSMAAPFVAGVAALAIERHGTGQPLTGYDLAPAQVARILTTTATNRPCPAGDVANYQDAGHPASWNASCEGTASENSLYGHGIVSATGAVR